MGIFRKIKDKIRRRKKITSFENLFPLNAVKKIEVNKELVLEFAHYNNPKVSIIIPFYNQIDYTKNCLISIHKNLPKNISIEIILVDDNSSEPINLSKIEGITVLKNTNNIGFLKSINNGISAAKAEYIYILNNDTEVKSNFLNELLYVFENFENVGAVGSKLINADGSLQEAGCVFLQNKEIHQIFLNKKVHYPEVNYIKRVDYCSGCSLLFKRKNELGILNLFDEQFVPAYFEETDFCFQLQFLQGKHVYINPFSEVLHYNGVTYNSAISSTVDMKITKSQVFEINKQKFYTKWDKQLSNIKANSINERIEELYQNKSIVFFVGIIPAFDKDSGSNRLKEIIEAYIKMGYHVTIIKDKTYKADSTYIEYYQRLGVNVFYEHNEKISTEKYLSQFNSLSKIAWFYNPDVFDEYYEMAKKNLLNAKYVFDMVDIHHLRLQRAAELNPNDVKFKIDFERYKKIEIEAVTKADCVITISPFEELYMKQFCKAEKLLTISNIHYPKLALANTLSFEERKDIVFVGSIHTPNIDAVYFLYNEIMPLVWQKIPAIKVNIIGNVNEVIKDIIHPNFIFRGYVPAIEDYFATNKLMIAPLRYGAGIKGKIGQAFEYYLPVVTTSIGAEGMQLIHEENALIQDSSVEFANAIITLYNNKDIWIKLQANSEKSLQPFSKEVLYEQLRKI
jgi:O-antigen biosynthesis protein